MTFGYDHIDEDHPRYAEVDPDALRDLRDERRMEMGDATTTDEQMRHSHRISNPRLAGEGFADWVARVDGWYGSWLAAHDAKVAANALRAVADTLGKDAITAAGLRMLADRKSAPELGSFGSEGSDQ